MNWKTGTFWVAVATAVGFLVTSVLPDTQADQIADWGDTAKGVLGIALGAVTTLVATIRKSRSGGGEE